MEETPVEEGDTNKDVEIAPALIAVHPAEKSVAVAVGSDLRVFDLVGNCPVSLVDESGGSYHKDSIRTICYGSNGQLFVSAGDDKTVKIWSTESWRCIYNVGSEKRVSAAAISPNGMHVCFADKFGVIWVVDLDGGVDGNQPLVNKKAVSLLSHYCSIITSLEFSLDGRFLVSADRDFKIRVTTFPTKPVNEAHEIQSFCLGHTDFVSCIAFISKLECPHGFIISGSGDSTVRLWDILSGSLLATCEIGDKVELLDSKEREGCHSAVTSICTIADGGLVAVAIQSLHGIILLNCDLSNHTLSVVKVVSISEETFIPTSLSSSCSTRYLWMVTGVSGLHNLGHSSLARVKVISGFNKDNPNSTENELSILEDDAIPGGEKLLEKLQGGVTFDEKVFLAASEAVKTAMSNLLTKKQYSTEKRDFRKRTRNDRKLKQG
ncbi:tRNA (guanine-N(7)-)-methyltransferase non-catalytic subunit wdr4 [Cucurbita pepo subsp. pepo]|uniref:tRNA (guanine-N(7)-)-methyltransferase non-catalytic subunit wdr4 n=1 Tax=Cucurbita pepo subsp. pepo TaxID=3664 RepID=UPI000C9D929A|nr:tRNA (guanine-N(7)-)-methyltransferase non-catalytic subunit wdr4 [Cucurbita pepo subsp. pepo]XP_023549063.1 tRNA (guanine-N(7)-)-methyltransferase non-catalytic subunit wdr4 [Cucurbita pepo subsp. pepo]